MDGITALMLASGSCLVPCILCAQQEWMRVRHGNPERKATIPGQDTALPSSTRFHLRCLCSLSSEERPP